MHQVSQVRNRKIFSQRGIGLFRGGPLEWESVPHEVGVAADYFFDGHDETSAVSAPMLLECGCAQNSGVGEIPRQVHPRSSFVAACVHLRANHFSVRELNFSPPLFSRAQELISKRRRDLCRS